MRILLIEDETRMAQAVSKLLRLENYTVDVCYDGITGQAAMERGLYDVMILDIMLPGKNGFALVQAARNKGIQTPILLLSAKAELDDKVMGLDCGADDYMTKPFMSRELLARIRALCRRHASSPDTKLTFADISLDPGASLLLCTKTASSVRLSEKEYKILEYLIINQKQILSRQQLAEKIWGLESDSEYNNVEVYMSFIRRKLKYVQADVEIKAVRGIGYMLRHKDV